MHHKQYKIFLLNGIALALLILFAYHVLHYQTLGSSYFDNDYKTIYHSLRDGRDVYAVNYYHIVVKKTENDHKTFTSAINLNTPSMNVILKGLVNISQSLKINTMIWVLISLLCIVFSVFLLMRWVSETREIKLFYIIALTLIACFNWSFLYGFTIGQLVFILLPLLVISFYLEQTGRLILSAIALGLLASLKIFFLVFALLYLSKEKRQLLAAFCLSFLICFLLPVLYFSWPTYLAFFKLTQDHMIFIQRSLIFSNGSLLGIICKLNFFGLFSSNSAALLPMYYAISLVFLIMWILYDYFYLRKLSVLAVNKIRFCFMLFLALFFSPLGWFYYYIYFLVSVFVFYEMSKHYTLTPLFFVYLALANGLPYFGWTNFSILVSREIKLFAVPVSLLCWLLCLCSVASCCAVSENKNKKVSSVKIIGSKKTKKRRFMEDNTQPVLSRQKWFLCIFILNAILSFVLLLFDFGFPHFFDGQYETYLKARPENMWIN